MPRLESRNWPADPSVPGPRRERQSLRYTAYVPDRIAQLDLRLSAAVAAVVSAAERVVDSLNRAPPVLPSLEVLARRLLWAESVASSRIEGLELSQRRLAEAEAGVGGRDETARSVLGNVAAMEEAVRLGHPAKPLRVADVLAIHRVLMLATTTPGMAGKLRDRQNWIGGNRFNPGQADFVPPPPQYVPDLMKDLAAFLNRSDMPPLVQAAIAHAQFETIHPFADGNGRVGRALIHVVLRRRELAPRFVPPLSLVLAGDSRAYIAGLTAYRDGRIEDWSLAFARAAERAAAKASELGSGLASLQGAWRERAGRPRRHSSAEVLIQLLPAYPIITLRSAAEILHRSRQAANEAIALLAQAGALRATTSARRNRAWEARELFDLVDAMERELATPAHVIAPRRTAPRGRRT
jgi:Fic family protein